MVVFWKGNFITPYQANLRFEEMLENCENDPSANCNQCSDCDEDGTYDDEDNCVGVYNPSQEDLDGDGFGDECDDCHDLLGDINDDFSIDILDIISIVNIILSGGINSEQFTECAISDANIDGNSVINILDVISIINLVLGDDRVNISNDNYAVAQIYYEDSDLVVRIESSSDIAGIEITIDSNQYFETQLKDNSHIETLSNYFKNTLKVISYNPFNEVFDGHIVEYRVIGGSAINQDDLDIMIGSPSGNEFYVTTNYNGAIQELGPNGYELYDPYPNPFNPSTQVSFSLPKESYVSLHAFNVIGEKVDTIFEGYQIKGNHTYTWDASLLSSGVYYIKMISDNNSLSRKVMLLK